MDGLDPELLERLREATSPGVNPEIRAEFLRVAAKIAEEQSRSEDAVFLRGRAAKIDESSQLLEEIQVPNENLLTTIKKEVERVIRRFDLERGQ